ncbi:uncharacterized protein LOC131941695 [Physella acuta]|uniref:uncharacterized protein LOC131941695 n=1 Tax=Physella acuta TaxID=109671 RepID=UPI0027DD9207|nr:uncharacterized protein LOC131941695 [Physella acuta]
MSILCCLPKKTLEINFSADEKLLIRGIWQEVSGKMEVIGMEAFMGMIEQHKEIAECFKMKVNASDIDDMSKRTMLRDHGLKLGTFLEKCIDHLEQVSEISKLSCNNGKTHFLNYVKDEYLDFLKVDYSRAVCKYSLNEWTPPHHQAWDKFLDLVLKKMKSGIALEQAKNQLFIKSL